ncbi:MAG: GNAT family N-acetyltransferase [Vitreoscilla sp.]
MNQTRPPLPILQGERCLLRALVPEDAPALVVHANDPAVARNLFDAFPQPYTHEAAEAWAAHEANSGAFGRVWAVVVNDSLVGCIGLRQEPGWLRCNAEIGYWIGQAFWRRGIASDAVRQVVDWAFAAVPEITRIHAPIFAGNDGSQAVVRQCGFVREAILPQSAIKDGQVIDRVVWAIYRTQVARRDADIGAALAATAADAMERA